MSGMTKEERWLVVLLLAMLVTGAVVRQVRRERAAREAGERAETVEVRSWAAEPEETAAPD
ncbi:MAG TPA: hypothetical protein VMN36_10935 [Verrucomicrobiales bacterium]|nr:hypothetical protein [Verrucomicrobiales bacterium]